MMFMLARKILKSSLGYTYNIIDDWLELAGDPVVSQRQVRYIQVRRKEKGRRQASSLKLIKLLCKL
jgi:hypothetical protein